MIRLPSVDPFDPFDSEDCDNCSEPLQFGYAFTVTAHAARPLAICRKCLEQADRILTVAECPICRGRIDYRHPSRTLEHIAPDDGGTMQPVDCRRVTRLGDELPDLAADLADMLDSLAQLVGPAPHSNSYAQHLRTAGAAICQRPSSSALGEALYAIQRGRFVSPADSAPFDLAAAVAQALARYECARTYPTQHAHADTARGLLRSA